MCKQPHVCNVCGQQGDQARIHPTPPPCKPTICMHTPDLPPLYTHHVHTQP